MEDSHAQASGCDGSLRSTKMISLETPVHRLPPEITTNIFCLVRGNPALQQRSESVFSVICLTHVCVQWRSIALSTPTLWTVVNIDRWDRALLSWLPVFLARSSKAPLDVQINCSPVKSKHILLRAIDLLVPETSRITHLRLSGWSIRGSAQSKRVTMVSGELWSGLRKFSELQELDLGEWRDFPVFPRRFPLLRVLHTEWNNLRWTSALLHLSHLSLGPGDVYIYPIRNLLAKLECCHNLESLHIPRLSCNDRMGDPEPIHVLQLNNLHTLALHGCCTPVVVDFIVQLSLPRLRHCEIYTDLDVCFIIATRPRACYDILYHLKSSCINVQSLDLIFHPLSWHLKAYNHRNDSCTTSQHPVIDIDLSCMTDRWSCSTVWMACVEVFYKSPIRELHLSCFPEGFTNDDWRIAFTRLPELQRLHVSFITEEVLFILGTTVTADLGNIPWPALKTLSLDIRDGDLDVKITVSDLLQFLEARAAVGCPLQMLVLWFDMRSAKRGREWVEELRNVLGNHPDRKTVIRLR